MLPEIVQDKLDNLLASETKPEPSFPSIQFAIEGLVLKFDLKEIVQLCYLLGKIFL